MAKSPKNRTTILESKAIATHCFYCERSFEEITKNYIYAKVIKTIDHFYPLSHNGKNHNCNKVICCFLCNQFKGSTKPAVLIEKLINDKKFLRNKRKRFGLFDFDYLDTFIRSITYLVSLQSQGKMNAKEGYYIKKEIASIANIEPEQSIEEAMEEYKKKMENKFKMEVNGIRLYKPLNAWLTYG